MTDNNTNNNNSQHKETNEEEEKEIRNSNLTTATTITADSNVTNVTNTTNEKNALIQVTEEESNKEDIFTGLGNLSTTAYDFYDSSRRFSDLSSENSRPTQHIVNLSNIEPQDAVDTSIPGSKQRDLYYGTNPNSPSTLQRSLLTQVQPTKETLAVKVLPLSIFLMGVAIATLVFIFIFRQDINRYQESFSYICTERISAIAAVFRSGIHTGEDFIGFFTVIANYSLIDDVDVAVNTFGDLSAIKNMGIRTMNFAPRILDIERLSYERKHGEIWQYNSQKQPVRRDNSAEYFPVRYSVPRRNDTQMVLNYDVSSEAERAAAITKARQTRNTTITTRISLAYDLNKGGILVFYPFYNGANNADVYGLVLGVFELDKTIESVTENFDDKSGIGIDIVDLENDKNIYTKDNNIEWYSDNFNIKKIEPIGDRNWSYTCYSSKDAYNKSVSALGPSIYFVLIVLFFSFVAFLTSNYFRKLFKARNKFTEQAAKLGRTQSLLKAITADSKAVLEAIADPLVALNAKGEIVGANKHALILTGYSPEEIKVANKMHINQLLIPIAETPIEEKNFNPLDGNDQFTKVPVRPGMRDVLARKKDGTLFEAEANFSQPVVEKNYFTQVVMFRDVSFKKENERIVMDAKKDADLANQSKTEFLFFLCHEIRNPAHAILGFAEMLKNSLKEKEELEYIISAGKFLSFIVNDILDLTHLTNPNPYEIELKCDGFNLHTLIDSIARIQSVEADHKQIQVKTIIGGELPINVYGDERRLEQVLMKLLARSIEVAPSNGIVELIVEQRKIHRSKGVLLRFSVKDQSKGLSSDEEIKELFQPYSKTNSSIGSRFHAQGLSMALAQAIVKVMGGRLVVEKVDRNSVNSISKGKADDVGNNRVWFEIWLLTAEAKERGKFLRESFDSVAISKNGSAGRNSFKLASAPGSTDGKLMDDIDFADSDNVTSQTQLRNSKSMLAKSKRDSKINKSLKKRRRATLTSATATLNSGEESNDDEVASNSETIKNVTSSSKSAATNFFRKGSIMLASGLARASTISNISISNEKSSSPLTANFSQNSVVEDSIHRDRNNATSVQELQESTPSPLPIISYYSGGNTSISPGSPVPSVSPVLPVPPLSQDRNLLLSKSTTKTDSVKSKSSSNISLPASSSVTNVNTLQNLSHDTIASTSTSSHGAHLPSLTSTADVITTANSTYNNNNDNNGQSSTLDNLADAQVTTVASTSASSEHQKQLKILLVEDNLVCQRVTNKMLKRNNYLVDIANHGKEAVDMVEAIQEQQQQYSCILMDIIMPIMNGYEATQLLRDRGVKIPILALTANSFGSDVKKAKDVGMDDFLTKPIKEAELIAAIKTQIEKYENIDSSQNQHDDSIEIFVEHKEYL